MKAILLKDFGGPEVMTYGDADQPQPVADQVLIKVHATSVNKPDVMQRMGQYPTPKGESEILGLEVAGVVEQIGADVTKWKKGDKVFALVAGGGYAEYCTAYQNHIVPIADTLSFNQAACICETYITAYLNVFLLGQLSSNQSVLLHGGGGGVNTAAIQLCKNLTPDVTIFVTCSTGKVDRVKALGVDHVIDYQQQSFADEIKALTGGKGVDVILDHIGGPYHQANMQSLALGGTLMQIGVSQGVKAEINLALMMVKRQRIIGSVLRSRPIVEKAQIIEQFEQTVLPLFANQTIQPLISNVFPLSEAVKAHQMMESSQHFGKIVLEV